MRLHQKISNEYEQTNLNNKLMKDFGPTLILKCIPNHLKFGSPGIRVYR